jgi:hypothetical protein
MQPKFLIVVLLLMSFTAYPQTTKVLDFKVKTAANAKDRTEMLNALRTDMFKEWKLSFEYVLDYFKVSGDYAWLRGTALRKDGKDMTFPDDSYDCCHVECLFQKKSGKWTVAASGAFSTDVWYWGLAKNYPGVPKGIFPKDSPVFR